MKAALWTVFAGLALLGFAVAGLLLLGAAALMVSAPPEIPDVAPSGVPDTIGIVPTPRPMPTPKPKPTPDLKRFTDHPGARRLFGRATDGAVFRLTFGFVDYAGRSHDVTCTLDPRDVSDEQAHYGVDEAEVEAEVRARVQARLHKEIERRGISRYVTLEAEGQGGWRWQVGEPVGDDDRGREEINGLTVWLATDLPGEVRAIEQRVYGDRGMLVEGDRLVIDHNGIARRATPHLHDCTKALFAAGEGYPAKQLAGLLLAFYQELKYELPPNAVGPRKIYGLWTPSEVLTMGKGDCDSKAVAFAAMWRRLTPRVIVIRVPGHALIGVEAKPGADETFVRVGNRYFVLLEVAGPGKLRPGMQPIQGTFQYVMIDRVESPRHPES